MGTEDGITEGFILEAAPIVDDGIVKIAIEHEEKRYAHKERSQESCNHDGASPCQRKR